MFHLWLLLAAVLCFPSVAAAQMQSLPPPEWVEMADLGDDDPKLAGLKAPRGVKVEIAAEGLIEGEMPAMAFGDDGTLYVLEWNRGGELRIVAEEIDLPGEHKATLHRTVKDSQDWLKSLHDKGGDGVYDEARVVMADLELPSALLLHDGWTWWISGGRVLRRRPHDAEMLTRLNAAAEEKKGPPTKATADGRWLEQELVRGLSALLPHEASGLAIGPDGLVYVTVGSGTSIVHGWADSQAAIVRSGSIFRLRPNGTDVEEFARGLHVPLGPITFNSFGTTFHADQNLQGTAHAGIRLLEIFEKADYGWLHARPAGTTGEQLIVAAFEPEPARSFPFGERPGTLPPMAKVAGGRPENVLLYSGMQFPEPLRGMLVVCDPTQHAVRAYSPSRDGGLWQAASSFALLQGDGDHFKPRLMAQGPDGAIYVATDSQPTRPGRIYRLSWSGTADMPAIELAPRDNWSAVANASDDELWTLLASDDGELRRRAGAELVARAKRDEATAAAIRQRLIDLMLDLPKPEPARAAALFASAHLADDAVREAWTKLLASEQLEIRRLATEAIGNHPPDDKAKVQELAEHVQSVYGSSRAFVTRSEHLTLGKLAAAGSTSAAEWSFEATSVSFGPALPRHVFDGHVRGLERAPGAARELMFGNLFVAIDFEITEFDERQRIKNFVVATAESMRTRELADFLDALLHGREDYLSKMESPLAARLIAAYQNVLTVPPANADAVAAWIENHEDAPAEVQLAALETLSLVGTTKPAVMEKLAASLLQQPETAKGVATRLIAGRIDRAFAPHTAAALRQHAPQDASGETARLLDEISKLPAAP